MRFSAGLICLSLIRIKVHRVSDSGYEGGRVNHANNYRYQYVQYRISLTYVAGSNEMRSTY